MAANSVAVRRTRTDAIFDGINMVIWVIILGVILYPLWLIVIASVSSPEAVMAGKTLLLPVDFSLIGYEAVFQHQALIRSYMNSIFYTVAGTALSIMVTMMTAYALTRKFHGKSVITVYFLFTMFFSGGLIPQFLMNRALGLYNTVLLMIIINCISVWNLMVARTYIATTIPNEMYEAAMIDGSDHFTYFFKVVLPLSGTIIAVLCLYYGVARWNDYFTALVYIRDRAKLPLQTILREIVATLDASSSNDELIASFSGDAQALAVLRRQAEVAKYCCIVVATAPPIILYIAMQKHFVKGVMIGSVKG